MTKRSARKMVRETADQLNARQDRGLNTCSAERAYGTVQRTLAKAGIELSRAERLALLAYAHGYVTGATGVKEERHPSLAAAIDARKDDHAAGVKAGLA